MPSIGSLDQALSPEEQHELAIFLQSDAVGDEAMPLWMLDGFFAAIVSGPEMLLPSQWLPVIWGDDENDAPTFADENEASTIMGLILRHYNAVNTSLRGITFFPLFCELPGQEQRYAAEMWATGYLAGVSLGGAAWQTLLNHQRERILIEPMLVICAPPGTFDEDPTEEEKIAVIPLLPKAAQAIYAHWQMKNLRSKQPVTMRKKTKTKRKKAKRQKSR